MELINKDNHGYWVREDCLAILQFISRILFVTVAFYIHWIVGIIALPINILLSLDHLEMVNIFWKHPQWTGVGDTLLHLFLEVVFPALKWKFRVYTKR